MVDLGSTNGTLVNGHRVEHATVTEGGTIRVGNTTMTVHFESPSDSAGGAHDVE